MPENLLQTLNEKPGNGAARPSEAEVLAALDQISAVLAPQFAFGFYDVDDIRQEIFLTCWRDALPGYDLAKGKLDAYFFRHARNRLLNMQRNLSCRRDPPCKICHGSLGNRSDHTTGEWCEVYVEWKKRNGAKKSLWAPGSIDHIDGDDEPRTRFECPTEDEAEVREMISLLDERLEPDLRRTMLMLKDGVTVSKARRDELRAAVYQILKVELPEQKADDQPHPQEEEMELAAGR